MTSGIRRWLRGWEVYAVFLGLPVWWALGAYGIIWPLAAVFLAGALLLWGRVVWPRWFLIWGLFLLWMLASATRVEGEGRVLAFLYRALHYFSASVLFLYLYNCRERLPIVSVVRTLAILFALVSAGGFLAVLYPGFGFVSPLAHVFPAYLKEQAFIHSMLYPRLADLHGFLGYPVPRPKTFFPYTNAWGSNLGLLLPFVLAAYGMTRSRIWRGLIIGVVLLSLVPLFYSLNRGAWVSVAAGAVYAALRFACSGYRRLLLPVLAFLAMIVVLVSFSPVGELFADRLAHPHSNEGRLARDIETAEKVSDAPLFGYGAPRPSEERPDAPSLGTHGQLFLVAFSHGLPGLVLFLLWFFGTFYVSWRINSLGSILAGTVILMGLVQSPFYELLPWQLHILMVAAALLWREALAPKEIPGGGLLRHGKAVFIP